LKAMAWLRVTQSGKIRPKARSKLRNSLSIAIGGDYTGSGGVRCGECVAPPAPGIVKGYPSQPTCGLGWLLPWLRRWVFSRLDFLARDKLAAHSTRLAALARAGFRL